MSFLYSPHGIRLQILNGFFGRLGDFQGVTMNIRIPIK